MVEQSQELFSPGLHQVSGGPFTVSAGFAGITEQFAVGAKVRIWREGNLATFGLFVLRSAPEKKTRSLKDFTTGVSNAKGEVTISKMSADSFANADSRFYYPGEIRVRIIAGKYRGRRLKSPPSYEAARLQIVYAGRFSIFLRRASQVRACSISAPVRNSRNSTALAGARRRLRLSSVRERCAA